MRKSRTLWISVRNRKRQKITPGTASMGHIVIERQQKLTQFVYRSSHCEYLRVKRHITFIVS